MSASRILNIPEYQFIMRIVFCSRDSNPFVPGEDSQQICPLLVLAPYQLLPASSCNHSQASVPVTSSDDEPLLLDPWTEDGAVAPNNSASHYRPEHT